MQETNRNAPICYGPRYGGGLVVGLIIIALGVILLLDRFAILDAHDILRYWPAILVAIGIFNLLEGTSSGSRVVGGLLTVVGGLLLLREFGYLPVRVLDLWPLALIAVGMLLLWKAIESGRETSPPASASVSRLRDRAIFGGVERRITAQDFEGGEAFAMFGGVELDLTKAAMRGNRAVIQANAIFGGVELRVPESWNVTMQGTGIFGGYSDQTQHPQPGGAPELVVRGMALFGNVEVRN